MTSLHRANIQEKIQLTRKAISCLGAVVAIEVQFKVRIKVDLAW